MRGGADKAVPNAGWPPQTRWKRTCLPPELPLLCNHPLQPFQRAFYAGFVATCSVYEFHSPAVPHTAGVPLLSDEGSPIVGCERVTPSVTTGRFPSNDAPG